MIEIDSKIAKAKAKLLVEYPYFGILASKIHVVINNNIETFKSNGKKLELNSDYLQKLKLSEMEFIFANGAMHSSLAHEIRKNARSDWLWQMATDMAINDMLVENGLNMPYGAQYRKRFSGLYSEEIYAELKADILRDDEDLEYNEKEYSDENKTKEVLQEEILEEQLLAEEAISILESEFKKGEAPTSIERFFKLDDFGKIDWRDELKVALDRYFRDDYTLLPPSKKFLSFGIYLPSTISKTFRLVIAIDSSSSIDNLLLNEFLSEVNFLMSLIQNYQIELIVCDNQIKSHKTFYSGDSLEVNLEGGGGTDFRPVFKFCQDKFDDIKLLLYFTDLDGLFPEYLPNYEVKWVVSKVKKIPFGEIILL